MDASLIADLNVRAGGLFDAAPGTILLQPRPADAAHLGSPANFLLVAAWTTANRAICQDFAQRLSQHSLLNSLLSLQLHPPLPEEYPPSTRPLNWFAALERKMQAHALVLELRHDVPTALVDCDVTFFRADSITRLFQFCSHEVCFMRETQTKGWSPTHDINSGLVVLPNGTQAAALKLVRDVGLELTQTMHRYRAGQLTEKNVSQLHPLGAPAACSPG